MLIDWGKAPRTSSLRAHSERKVVTGQQISVVLADTGAEADFDGRPHRHVNEQWVVVIAGRLRMTCGDEEFEMATGDMALLPAQSWHAAVGVGPEGARYLEFSAPPRLDLLPGSLLPSALEFPETNRKTH